MREERTTLCPITVLATFVHGCLCFGEGPKRLTVPRTFFWALRNLLVSQDLAKPRAIIDPIAWEPIMVLGVHIEPEPVAQIDPEPLEDGS